MKRLSVKFFLFLSIVFVSQYIIPASYFVGVDLDGDGFDTIYGDVKAKMKKDSPSVELETSSQHYIAITPILKHKNARDIKQALEVVAKKIKHTAPVYLSKGLDIYGENQDALVFRIIDHMGFLNFVKNMVIVELTNQKIEFTVPKFFYPHVSLGYIKSVKRTTQEELKQIGLELKKNIDVAQILQSTEPPKRYQDSFNVGTITLFKWKGKGKSKVIGSYQLGKKLQIGKK